MLARIFVGQDLANGTRKEWTAHIDGAFIEAFGGFSRHNVNGGWKGSDGKVYLEESTVWEVQIEDSQRERDVLEAVARFARDTFRQESVLVQYIQSEGKFL